MTRDADLRQHALELLEQAKKFLEEDGELDPTAFIITRNDQVLRPIGLRDKASKVRSCKKILNEARKLHARAIITLFIARSKDFDHEKFGKRAVQAPNWSGSPNAVHLRRERKCKRRISILQHTKQTVISKGR